MDLPAAGFEWDRGNIAKCRSHGLEIEAIQAVFQKLVWVVPDPIPQLNSAIGRSEPTMPAVTYSLRSLCGTFRAAH